MSMNLLFENKKKKNKNSSVKWNMLSLHKSIFNLSALLNIFCSSSFVLNPLDHFLLWGISLIQNLNLEKTSIIESYFWISCHLTPENEMFKWFHEYLALLWQLIHSLSNLSSISLIFILRLSPPINSVRITSSLMITLLERLNKSN